MVGIKCLQLRSEGTFYLLIHTEENRCSHRPELSVLLQQMLTVQITKLCVENNHWTHI